MSFGGHFLNQCDIDFSVQRTTFLQSDNRVHPACQNHIIHFQDAHKIEKSNKIKTDTIMSDKQLFTTKASSFTTTTATPNAPTLFHQSEASPSLIDLQISAARLVGHKPVPPRMPLYPMRLGERGDMEISCRESLLQVLLDVERLLDGEDDF
jgi:hypothetical protein